MGEMLGTLFGKLMALLSIAAVATVLYQVFGSNKIQNAVSDLTLLQANTQLLYNGQSTFTTVTNGIAISGKLAPSSMISGGALVNPWGGTITINVNGSNANQFDITETLVPADACAKMSVGMTSAIALKINGAAQVLPLDAGTAVVACNSPLANTLILTTAH